MKTLLDEFAIAAMQVMFYNFDDEESVAEHSYDMAEAMMAEREKRTKCVTESKPSAKVFKKPTLDEVGEYCQQRKNGIDPKAFYDHYESNGWKVGRSPMKNWQSAVRTWENMRKNRNSSFTPIGDDDASPTDGTFYFDGAKPRYAR